MNTLEKVWVDSKFKKFLKIEAAKQDKTVAKLTHELSLMPDPFFYLMKRDKDEKKKRNLDFP